MQDVSMEDGGEKTRERERFNLTVSPLLLPMKIARPMILHAVRELVLGMRHVVERIAVLLPLLFVAVQIVRVVPVIHRVRHFHLVHGPLDRAVKLEVRGCQ